MKKDFKTDILTEIANIGTGQAATALSMMLSRKVLISVPSLKLLPIEEIPQNMGGSEMPIIGIYFNIIGDLSGRILLVFDRKSGHNLVAMLTGKTLPDLSTEPLAEIDMSAIMEIGNIITNSYLNGLAGLLDITLFPSIPYFAEDTLGAVIDALLIEISTVADQALIIDTQMSIENENLKGSFMVFPDEEFLNKIMSKLGMQEKEPI